MKFILPIITAIGNRMAGTGRRVALPVSVGLVAWMLPGSPLEAALAAVSAYLWRSIGWQGALDMGTNDGTVLRDTAVMFVIALTLGLAWSFIYGATWWIAPPFIAAGITACYGFAMHRYRTNPSRTAYAEIATGLWLGICLMQLTS